MASTVLDNVIPGNQIVLGGVTYNVTEFDPPTDPTIADASTTGGQPKQYIIKIYLQSVGDTGQNRASDYPSAGDDPRLGPGAGQYDTTTGTVHT